MTDTFFKPFGIDIFCLGKKFLVYNIVGRNLKVKYRRSVFGVLWTLLSPLSLVGIYYFAFKVVMRVDTPNYLAFLVSGILPWSFFAQTIVEGMDSITSNTALVSKIPIPLQVFPFVNVVTNLTTLLLGIPILIGVSVFTDATLGPSLILLPFLLSLLALTCYGVSIILSLAFVFFQDLKHLMSIIVQLWFYATPVLYGMERIPERYHWVVYANPVGTNFVMIHKVLTAGTWPTLVELGFAIGWSLVILLAAILLFKKLFRNVAENL